VTTRCELLFAVRDGHLGGQTSGGIRFAAQFVEGVVAAHRLAGPHCVMNGWISSDGFVIVT
jgi:hypothetical protein